MICSACGLAMGEIHERACINELIRQRDEARALVKDAIDTMGRVGMALAGKRDKPETSPDLYYAGLPATPPPNAQPWAGKDFDDSVPVGKPYYDPPKGPVMAWTPQEEVLRWRALTDAARAFRKYWLYCGYSRGQGPFVSEINEHAVDDLWAAINALEKATK